MDESELATVPSAFVAMLGRKGKVKGLRQTRPLTIYHSNAGEAYRTPDVSGHPWDLDDTCNLTRTGNHVDRGIELRQQGCIAGDRAWNAINRLADQHAALSQVRALA